MFKKIYANPFNWTGSKHRYLKELMSVLPLYKRHIRVLDPFVGGGDLVSKLPLSWHTTASDTMSQIVDLHIAVKAGLLNIDHVRLICNERDLSRTNKDSYLQLRDEYNKTKSGSLLYPLITCSFNNQMRFNKSGEFNMPFGEREFNPAMEQKLDNYVASIKCRDIKFLNESYEYFDFSAFDLLLIDPPYSNTTATYNESTKWDEQEDVKLFNKIDESGTDFVYFNQTYSKGVPNNTLIEWMKKYDHIVLKETSKGCSYQRDNSFTEEVMIYKITK